jgi:hypothetical protein
MLFRLLAVLIANAVPLVGVVRLGWSAPTLLVLYWCETVMQALASSVRIAVHRRLTRDPGHWRVGAGTFLSQSAAPVFLFGGVHAVFIAALLGVLTANHVGGRSWLPDLHDLRNGVSTLALVILGELVCDLRGMAERPFFWLQAQVDGLLGRVLVMHLTIIFGLLLIARFETPVALLSLLVGLKALIDVAGVWSRRPLRQPAVVGNGLRSSEEKAT